MTKSFSSLTQTALMPIIRISLRGRLLADLSFRIFTHLFDNYHEILVATIRGVSASPFLQLLISHQHALVFSQRHLSGGKDNKE